LRALGWSVRHLCDVYPDDGQHVADEDWIAHGVNQGWSLLTQDKKIRYRAHERGALLGGKNAMFCLDRQDLLVADKVSRFHSCQSQINRAALRGEASIYVVHDGRIEKKWP